MVVCTVVRELGIIRMKVRMIQCQRRGGEGKNIPEEKKIRAPLCGM
jgi:hypothetical protein